MARSPRQSGPRGVVDRAALGADWLGLGLGHELSLLAAPGADSQKTEGSDE